MEALVNQLLQIDDLNSSPETPIVFDKLAIQMKSLTSSLRELTQAFADISTHYPVLVKIWKDNYQKVTDSTQTPSLTPIMKRYSSLMSLISMTRGKLHMRESLYFRVLAGVESILEWGHPYIRHLTREIRQELQADYEIDPSIKLEKLQAEHAAALAAEKSSEKVKDPKPKPEDPHIQLLKDEIEIRSNLEFFSWRPSQADLEALGLAVAPYLMSHHAQSEACDLLMILGKVPNLFPLVTEKDAQKVGLYLTTIAEYVPEPEHSQVLTLIYDIYMKFKKLALALRSALQLNSKEKVHNVFRACKSRLLRKQLAIILGRHCVKYGLDDDEDGLLDDQSDDEDTDCAIRLQDISSFTKKKKKKKSAASKASSSNDSPKPKPMNTDEDDEDEEITASGLVRNSILHKIFLFLGKSLDMLEPKIPKDIYKDSISGRDRSNRVSSQYNLASSISNAFLNAGFCSDKLISDPNENWVFKHQQHGQITAAASLGLIHLWNSQVGPNELQPFKVNSNKYISAGGLLGFGILNANVRHEFDAPISLTAYLGGEDADSDSDTEEEEEAEEEEINPTELQRASATLGLGISYAGVAHRGVMDRLISQMEDEEVHSRLVKAFSSLALGYVGVGTCDSQSALAIVELLTAELAAHPEGYAGDVVDLVDPKDIIKQRKQSNEDHPQPSDSANGTNGAPAPPAEEDDEEDTVVPEYLKNAKKPLRPPYKPWTAPSAGIVRYACLGLGLLFLGAQNKADSMLVLVSSALKPSPIRAYAIQTLETLAYFGSGDVLQIQKLLGICGYQPKVRSDDPLESFEPLKPDNPKFTVGSTVDDISTFIQEIAVIGVAGCVIRDPIGQKMAIRLFDRMQQYGRLPVKRALPLAFALMSISQPQMEIVHKLSKYSHDSDPIVSLNAILGLGLVSAGTNNSRIGKILRELISYHHQRKSHMFLARVALGLTYLGKGTLSIHPLHSHRALLNPVAIAGIMTVIHSSLDIERTILGNYHYMLYTLAMSMFPRLTVTIDQDLKPIPTQLRVGEAIDVIGQAGTAKRLTGFQTQESPVLYSTEDQVELVGTEFEAMTPVLEYCVFVKKGRSFGEHLKNKTTKKNID